MKIKVKISRENIFKCMVLICVFLFSLNFYDRYYYFIFLAFGIFLLMPRQRFKFDLSFLFLVLFGISILIFNEDSRESIFNMIRPFTFAVAYIISRSLMKQKDIKTLISIIAAGTFLHYFLNMMINIGATERNTIDIWTGNIMSATMQACFASISIGVLVGILFSDVKKRKKLIAVLLIAVILSYNLVLAGRTLFFLLLIVSGVAFLYQYTQRKEQTFYSVLGVIVLVAAVIILYKKDVFGIQSMIENSNFFVRFFSNSSKNIVRDHRFQFKLYYLKRFLDSPWGGNYIYRSYGMYAHDLYLDVYDESGIFAFLAIVIYVMISLMHLVKYLQNREIPYENKQLVLCVYCAINIQFWLEPIVQGAAWLLASYCVIDGMVANVNANRKISRGNQG